jgi:hypothetical protein
LGRNDTSRQQATCSSEPDGAVEHIAHAEEAEQAQNEQDETDDRHQGPLTPTDDARVFTIETGENQTANSIETTSKQ